MKRHPQEQEVGKRDLETAWWRKSGQLQQEWNKFQPLMQSNLFHTTAFIDGYNQLCTLMDPGSSIYASIAKTPCRQAQTENTRHPPPDCHWIPEQCYWDHQQMWPPFH